MKLNSIIAGLCLIALTLGGCDSGGGSENGADDFPQEPAEIKEVLQAASRLADAGWNEIEQAIIGLPTSGGAIDPVQIASGIESVDGVRSAETTPSGIAIVAELEAGAYANVLVARQNDERLFEPATGKKGAAFAPTTAFEPTAPTAPGARSGAVTSASWTTMPYSSLPPEPQAVPADTRHASARISATEFPTGSRNALILAPFQSAFNNDLAQIQALFESAHFTVDVFVDADADLDRFRADHLANYDIVFIESHGAANVRTQDGRPTTMLLTGEVQSEAREGSLSLDERRAVALGVDDGAAYYAVTPQWLTETMTGEFSRAWFFAGAMESGLEARGAESLSRALFDLGAGGFSGFFGGVSTILAGAMAEKLAVHASSGSSLSEASILTRTDFGLGAAAWTVRVQGVNAVASVETLVDRQRISENYHLFNPEEIVGFATVAPSYGVPGTSVVFEVGLREAFENQVTEVVFEILSTGERFPMLQVTPTIWRAFNLIAPEANAYPQVDTFTFTAYNGSDTVGQGSASFTIYSDGTSN